MNRFSWKGFAAGARRLAGLAARMGGLQAGLQLRGDWRLECGRLRPDGTIEAHTVRGWTQNLVVNAGLDAVVDRLVNPATVEPVWGFIAIGSDATPEASGQTALGSELARGAVTFTAGGVGVATIERTFAAGVGTGSIAEAGAFNDAAVGTMLNRKAFTAIPKAAGDTLKVTCVLTVAPA